MQTAHHKVTRSFAVASLALLAALSVGVAIGATGAHASLSATARPAQAIPCRSDPVIRYLTANGQHVETLRIVASYRAVRPQPTRFLVRLPQGARVLSVWRENASEHVSIVVGGAGARAGARVTAQTWHWDGVHWISAHTQTWHWTTRTQDGHAA